MRNWFHHIVRLDVRNEQLAGSIPSAAGDANCACFFLSCCSVFVCNFCCLCSYVIYVVCVRMSFMLFVLVCNLCCLCSYVIYVVCVRM